ncbi:indolepyruvate oxidoreductase subunit beta [Caldicellulosiruptoraceae bacterium PP1]
MTKSILVVGVGGQGNLLLSRILGDVFLSKGFDVKISEVHGMAQRGGSVVTYVKFGEKIYSPLIEKNEADFILAFEKLEGLRWIDYLKDDGVLILNDYEIPPMSVISGISKYPDVISILEKQNLNYKLVDLNSVVNKLNSSRVMNIALLGYFSKYFDFSEQDWIDAIKRNIKEKFIDINLKAFSFGKEL